MLYKYTNNISYTLYINYWRISLRLAHHELFLNLVRLASDILVIKHLFIKEKKCLGIWFCIIFFKLIGKNYSVDAVPLQKTGYESHV